MKELNGLEVVGFIKERQAHEVRALMGECHIRPKLAIVRTSNAATIDLYIRLKKQYGLDIGIDVEEYFGSETEMLGKIKELNADDSVHGMVVQLPLANASETETLLAAVSTKKDVDGLAPRSEFEPATPSAIMWLLAAYNIDLRAGQIAVIGQGRLVGAPLTRMLAHSGYQVVGVDHATLHPEEITRSSRVIITAVGAKDTLRAAMVSPGSVVVDAGVATESEGFVGDVNDDVRELADIRITPKKGGVGPLTVAAIFENTITAAKMAAQV